MFRQAFFLSILGLVLTTVWAAAQSQDAVKAANAESARLLSAEKYNEALPHMLKTLERAEKELGKEDRETLSSLTNLARLYKAQGRYDDAEPLYKRVLEVSERELGGEHPDTLASLNNLAVLYNAQGRYGEAELLYKRVLEKIELVLGKEHPNTLSNLNNLAELYRAQGRYDEAELRYKRAQETQERVLGAEHPSTLNSLNNLALLYKTQGRYGEAELLYKRALETRERVLGGEHTDTLQSLNNLAGLYQAQGRYGEAEPLKTRALKTFERVLGEEHPYTLTSLNNLALLYRVQGRYDKAEPLYKRLLEAMERTLGNEHPNTLGSINNLAGLYQAQGRYGEAEPLYKRALETSEHVLGKEHPYTLTGLQNLAFLYQAQGLYAEAEPLYERALEARERVLGKEHPDTLGSLGNLATLLVTSDKTEEALSTFRTLDDRLAGWLDAEIGNTQGGAVRRQILQNRSGNQNAMFSFALRHPSDASARFAADLTLRWKKRLLQHEAYLVNLTRTSPDQKIVDAVETIRRLGTDLSNAFFDPKVSFAAREALKQRFEAAQAELRRLSPEYRKFRETDNVTTHQVQTVLSNDGALNDAALIEYRFFNPFDFKTRQYGPQHLIAAILRRDGSPALIDLGEAAPIIEMQQQMINLLGKKSALQRPLSRYYHLSTLKKRRMLLLALQRGAYDRLIGPLMPFLINEKTLIISPEGKLNALPFDILMNEKRELLTEARTVSLVQSGRDLTRNRIATAKGLVAFGGIDFGKPEIHAQGPSATTAVQVAQLDQGHERLRVIDIFNSEIGPIKPLKASGDEVDVISEYYKDHSPNEPEPIVHKGRAATEARLKALAPAPRVLHLATHGFYLQNGALTGQPLLQSGITMALANDGLAGKLDADGENGIIQAIEAAGLNLVGTELVVLSACKSAQGVTDYSEGLEGLPTAFYVAGAKNVLVTLWNVDDESTKEFMNSFYRRWLNQRISDPAAALRETKTFFKSHPQLDWRDPQTWAAFVLFEG